MSIRKRWAATTPRFDVYANPDQAVPLALYVVVQSDFVRLNTRLCIPLRRHRRDLAVIQGAQALLRIGQIDYVLDTPNLLSVPAVLLRRQAERLSTTDQMQVESCIEFMLGILTCITMPRTTAMVVAVMAGAEVRRRKAPLPNPCARSARPRR